MPALRYWDTGSSSYVLLTPGATTFPFTYMQTLTAPTVASSPYQINHNLNTTTPLVQIWDAVTGQMVQTQVTVVNANSVQITVAQNMPNNVNVIVVGSAQAPVPVAPADYASKSYVDARTPNLPPPVTSGTTIQSYTDPTGEIFVAKNGVNAGAWKRARDVLYAKWYRNTTLNITTSLQDVGYDTMVKDDYGLYDGIANFSPCFNGWWEMHVSFGCTFTATGQSCQSRIVIAATYASLTLMHGSFNSIAAAKDHVLWYVGNYAASNWHPQIAASVALAGYILLYATMAEFSFKGTG
jgi:hypothetical protein